MDSKRSIKVIKKIDIGADRSSAGHNRSAGKTDECDMSSTVSGWVRELQQRRNEESLLAPFRSLGD